MLPPNAWLRWDTVTRRLPEDAETLLEVGCGQGGFAVRLASRYRYVGVEPDAESFAVARARLGSTGDVRNGDLSTLDPDERFDVVCAFEVIEHIEDDGAMLAEWADRLNPGGWLIVSAPAWQQRFAAWDEMVGHLRRYDPPDLVAKLRDIGLDDVEVTPFGAPLGFALEAIRNRIAARRRGHEVAQSVEARTAGSGRLLKPRSGAVAVAAYLGTFPFLQLQRAFPNQGVGLVAVGRRSAA